MNTGKAEKGKYKDLVENDPLAVRGLIAQSNISTKKPIRRETVPHIRPHVSNGKKFYYHVDGSGPEKYLGDAGFILRAVTMYRQQGGK